MTNEILPENGQADDHSMREVENPRLARAFGNNHLFLARSKGATV
ncbi:hypothetical protein [Profundibacter sp.]